MSTDEQLQALHAEVEQLKLKAARADEGPWFKKPATIIAILALGFSFGTTLFASFNSHQEDVRANRRDVRAVLQRLSKLPIENYELMEKFKGVGQGEALSGMINQENVLLATQSAELVDRFPSSFTSTEYFSVAVALANSNIVGKVPRFFERAMDSATSSNDYNVAARSYGAFLYSKGELTEGRRRYGEAMDVWKKFPERNAYVIASTELMTLMMWSQSEFAAGNRPVAKEKLAQAREKFAALTPGPYTDSLRNQIAYVGRYVDAV